MRSVYRFSALLLCTLLLGGCGHGPIRQETDTVQYDMPAFSMEYEAPLGDYTGVRNVHATLYGVSAIQDLTGSTRSIRIEKNENMYVKVLQRLLEMSSSASTGACVPEGTTVRSVSLSGTGYAVVDLSSEALALSAQEMARLRLSIVMTLTEFEAIDTVSVLVDGREETGLEVPCGALSRTDGGFPAYWAQLQSEETGKSALTRVVPLYFAAEYGKMLVCETRAIRFEGTDYITPVIEALLAGPSSIPLAQRTLPSGGLLAEGGARIVTSLDGRKLIELCVRGDFEEQLARQKLDFDTVCASLAYTLCRFVPETDGIVLLVGDAPLTDEAVSPAQDPGRFGRLVMVCVPTAQDTLRREAFVLSQWEAESPRSLLLPLQEQFPEGVTDADLIAVATQEDTALVNLSANFYRQCQTLTARQEQLLAYAMVNTLTEDSSIRQVQFFVNGEYADTLGGTISIRGPLMRNVGLIQ